jgi:uncharacterized membrane protein SpoIIM required for sporulation
MCRELEEWTILVFYQAEWSWESSDANTVTQPGIKVYQRLFYSYMLPENTLILQFIILHVCKVAFHCIIVTFILVLYTRLLSIYEEISLLIF